MAQLPWFWIVLVESWPLTKPLNTGVVNFLLSPQVYGDFY